MRKRKGFTLAELLIVVAIIAVLVAIAIPVFTSSLEKARETTCLANQTSAQHVLTYEKLFDTKITKDNWKSYVEAAMGDINKLCPSEGKYRYNVESGIVSCEKHNATSVEIVNRTPAAVMELETVQKYFFKEDGTRISRKQLDSSGPNFGPDTRVQIQKALGLPDDKFDFRIYWPIEEKNPKVYVFKRITLDNVGQEYDVTGYLLVKNSNEKWEIDQTVTGQGTVRKASVDGKDYAQMNVENIQW